MKKTKFDEYLGNHNEIALRVAPIDVGFDLRTQQMGVVVPRKDKVASYDDRGERYVVTGTAAEIVEELRRAGYNARLEGVGWRELGVDYPEEGEPSVCAAFDVLAPVGLEGHREPVYQHRRGRGLPSPKDVWELACKLTAAAKRAT